MSVTIPRRSTGPKPPGSTSRLWALAIAVLIVHLTVFVFGWHPWTTSTEAPVGRAPDAAAPNHEVAILSVDFDPPPGASVVAGKPRALLVVVDNRGTESESKLIVEADVYGDGSDDVVSNLSEPISALAPGEVRVVRFESISSQPRVASLKKSTLLVRVKPGDGETEFPTSVKSVLVDWARLSRVD